MDIKDISYKIAQNFISQFPETKYNAYPYFNYDNRIVEESVDRKDKKDIYQGPEELTNADYTALVSYALSLIDSNLLKYSKYVACEDALNYAIRTLENGKYDGKINANKFRVLINSMIKYLK